MTLLKKKKKDSDFRAKQDLRTTQLKVFIVLTGDGGSDAK